jgi:hypothetical protein
VIDCGAREIVKVRSTVAEEYVDVCAEDARTTQSPAPEKVRVRVPEVTEHDDAVVETTE